MDRSQRSLKEEVGSYITILLDSRFRCFHRRQKLEESLQFQQFLVGADEAEAWLNEKTTLACSDEVGDTLAAVQVGTLRTKL